jgi:hypothetical protein
VTSAAEQGTRRDHAGLRDPSESFVTTPEHNAPARENPLFAPSTLPFGAPPFDRIRDTDYGGVEEACVHLAKSRHRRSGG